MNGMKYQEIMLYVKEINKCKNNKIEELMNDVLTKKGYEGNDANNFFKNELDLYNGFPEWLFWNL